MIKRARLWALSFTKRTGKKITMYEIYTWEEPDFQIFLRDGPLEKWWGEGKSKTKKNLQEIINKKNISLRILAKKYMPKEEKKTNLHVQKRDLASLKTLTPFPLNTFLMLHPWSIRLVPDGWWQFAPYIWFYSSSARCYLVLSVLCTTGKNNPF